ncbi:MAG: IS481 family transposase [bacterium]|nr:IS481 family transposase [bacterium]
MSQKKAFIESVLSGEETFRQVCNVFQISRQAGYKLLKRFKQEGYSGLQTRARKPHTIPHKTSSKIEDKIIKLRIKQPTWGARKIEAYYERQGIQMPCRSVITDILKRRGYIDREESLKRKKLIRFEKETHNELWQMDFKGCFAMLNLERCYPLTILDDHSRFLLCIYACKGEKRLPVQKRLKHVFEEYGLPEQINVDNGNPWGNARLFKHTQLTVWLMRLGIKVSHSRPRHPQTNGKLERFHRTLKNDVIKRNEIKNLPHAQHLFTQWREIYNNVRPHEALQMLTPHERYQPSIRKMPAILPSIEYADGAVVRKVRGNGGFSIDGKEFFPGEAFQGLPVEVRKNEETKTIEVFFCRTRILLGHLL